MTVVYTLDNMIVYYARDIQIDEIANNIDVVRTAGASLIYKIGVVTITL